MSSETENEFSDNLGSPPIDFSDSGNEENMEAVYKGIMNDESNFNEEINEIICDPSQFNNQSYINTIQSLIPAVLAADGSKLKNGYLADEIALTLKETVSISLEELVLELVGKVQNTNNVSLAHALVDAKYLKFVDGLFFPIIKTELQNLTNQIVAGAEAADRFKEKKKNQKKHSCKENEIRAMHTYNMLVLLIDHVMNELGKKKITFNELSSGYQTMLEKRKPEIIYQTYNSALDLNKHGQWNKEWFKYYTGRSSLKKFASIDQFSGIEVGTAENENPTISLRERNILFKAEDFEKVEKRWEDQETNHINDRFHRQNNKESEPIEAPKSAPKELYHSDVTNSSTTNKKSNSNIKIDVAGSRAAVSNFGGNSNLFNQTTNYTQNESENEKTEISDSELSSDPEESDGEYSDDSEEVKEQRRKRKQEREEKNKRKLEKIENKLKSKQTTINPPLPFNRFYKSVFEMDEPEIKEDQKIAARRPSFSSSERSSKPEKSLKEAEIPTKLNEESKMKNRIKKEEKKENLTETSESEKKELKERQEYLNRKRIEMEEAERVRKISENKSKTDLEKEKYERKMETFRLEEEDRRKQQELEDAKLAKELDKQINHTEYSQRSSEYISRSSFGSETDNLYKSPFYGERESAFSASQQYKKPEYSNINKFRNQNQEESFSNNLHKEPSSSFRHDDYQSINYSNRSEHGKIFGGMGCGVGSLRRNQTPRDETVLSPEINRWKDRIVDFFRQMKRKEVVVINEDLFRQNFSFSDELPYSFSLTQFVKNYMSDIIMIQKVPSFPDLFVLK